jgi:carbon-monoxide dehydrogenase large subunit
VRAPHPPSRPLGFRPTAQPVFADPLVRYVGEVVAAVVAEDPYVAADAAAACSSTTRPRGHHGRALEPGTPMVFDGWPDNVAGLHRPRGRRGAGFGSDVVVGASASPGCQGPDRTAGSWPRPRGPTAPHPLDVEPELRAALGRRGAFGLAEGVRVVVVDTGGGFGSGAHLPQDLIVAAARQLGRPVKWASRGEHFDRVARPRPAAHGASADPRPDHRVETLPRGHLSRAAGGDRNTINHCRAVPDSSLEIAASNVVTSAVFGAAYRGSGGPSQLHWSG